MKEEEVKKMQNFLSLFFLAEKEKKKTSSHMQFDWAIIQATYRQNALVLGRE